MKHTKEDFNRFVEGDEYRPSEKLSQEILATVRADLNPSPWKVFSKLIGIHFAVSLLTLSICPQFGFRLATEGMGLMHYFMSFGEVGCAVACGSFFLGTSVLAATLLLRGEELRVIRGNRWVGMGALALLSLGGFFMLDTDLVFGVVAAWMAGAIATALLSLELGWRLRFRTAA